MERLVYVKQFTQAISNDPYSAEDESYETCYLFICLDSLDAIMQQHIRIEYSVALSYSNISFPTDFDYKKEYYLYSQILFTLVGAVKYYFERASIIEKFNIDKIVVKFTDIDDNLSVEEAIKSCQNIFLKLLPLEKKLYIAENIIFKCNYNSVLYDFIKEQEFNDFNFYALVYFMYIDLNELTVEDLNFVHENKFTKVLKINPFTMHKDTIQKKVNEIFGIAPSGVKKNHGKIFTRLESYKRMFDVYLHVRYLSEEKWTYHKCILYLISRGHNFSEPVDMSDRSADTIKYNIYIKEDKKTITTIQKIAEEYF